MDLKCRVENGFAAVGFTKVPNVKVQHHSEMFPTHPEPEDSYIVSVDLSQEPRDKRIPEKPQLKFRCNLGRSALEISNIQLGGSSLAEQGYGRRIVEAMEDIGRSLGLTKSVVSINRTVGFWQHMGYGRVDGRTGKYL
ncbi:MAG: hypothetical protein ABIG93_00345 [archaeon]|nr:hypothetical protein [Nanoarchaeota archaeon]